MRDWEVKEKKTKFKYENWEVGAGKKTKGVEEVIRLLGKCDCGNELSFYYYYLKLFLNLKVQMGSPRHDWVACSVR